MTGPLIRRSASLMEGEMAGRGAGQDYLDEMWPCMGKTGQDWHRARPGRGFVAAVGTGDGCCEAILERNSGMHGMMV